MQSGLVEDRRIEEIGVISHLGTRWGSGGGPFARQGFDDIPRVGRAGQACHLFLVAQHACEPP